MARLVLTIEIPDDIMEADLIMMRGVKSSITVDGIQEELHTWLLLAAADAYERDTRRREHAEANPLMSTDIMDAIVAPAARLALVDALMHLPSIDSEGVITPI
jgi:hypothetical protein